jgi:lipopolysaccharide transport system ATP-binding protein
MAVPGEAEVLVSVEGVSRRFCRGLRRSLWYGLGDIAADLNPFGAASREILLRRDEFWAVRDVSFALRRGECLGLIGPNGAGKTTLLKMLTGVIKPDTGRIAIHGRVGALIALGAGFNPVLTGRENIYVNGSVLGIRKSEIDRQFEDIVDFAEIPDFIDSPVQNYSSGMIVRLGFSIAVKLIKPDVLILDEVIAVGDEAFRSKCYQEIDDLLARCAVVFVSHSMPMVQRLSTEVLTLSRGEAVFLGDPTRAIERYLTSVEASNDPIRQTLGTGEATIHRFEVLDEHGRATGECRHGRPYRLSMDLTVLPAFPEYSISVSFMTRAREIVAQCRSSAGPWMGRHDGEPQRVEVAFDAQLLNPGRYSVSVVVFDGPGTRHLCWDLAVASFTVVGSEVGNAPVQLLGDWAAKPLPCPAPQGS